jgi:hypothetical protein
MAVIRAPLAYPRGGSTIADVLAGAGFTLESGLAAQREEEARKLHEQNLAAEAEERRARAEERKLRGEALQYDITKDIAARTSPFEEVEVDVPRTYVPRPEGADIELPPEIDTALKSPLDKGATIPKEFTAPQLTVTDTEKRTELREREPLKVSVGGVEHEIPYGAPAPEAEEDMINLTQEQYDLLPEGIKPFYQVGGLYKRADVVKHVPEPEEEKEPRYSIQRDTDPITGKTTFRTFDLNTGQEVRTGGGGGGSRPAVPEGLEGQKLYESLDPNLQALVDQALDGELDLTSKRLNPRQSYVLALSKRIDPDFNPQDARAYAMTVREFTNTSAGKAGGNLIRMNTALEHLREWKAAADALANGDVRAANRFVQFMARELGDPTIMDFETAAAAVGDEFAAVYKGGAPDIETQRTWRAIFANPGLSQEQFDKAYEKAKGLAHGRLVGMRQEWRGGTSFNRKLRRSPDLADDPWADEFDRWLTPAAMELFEVPPGPAGAPEGTEPGTKKQFPNGQWGEWDGSRWKPTSPPTGTVPAGTGPAAVEEGTDQFGVLRSLLGM